MNDYSKLSDIKISEEKVFNFENAKSNTDELLVKKTIEYKPYSNLSELFKAYDTGELFKCGIDKQNIVSGIVELLKYKYLGQPLIADFVLNEKSKTDKDGKYLFPGVVFSNNGEYCNINRIGFTDSEIELLQAYFDNLDEETKKSISFYDLLNSFLEDEVSNDKESIKEKISIIKNYKKSKLEEDTVGKLRESLDILLLRRNALDKLIENIQTEIDLRTKNGENYGRGR